MIDRRSFVLSSLALAALAGCGPAAPVYQDPLLGLSPVKGETVPPDVPIKAGKSVAWTFGANVEKYVDYSDKGEKFAASMGAGQKLLKEGDPQNLVNGGVALLRQHYPQIKPVQDLATAARQHVDTTFVLDIRVVAGIWPGDETTADLLLIAFDGQQKPVSRVSGHGAVKIKPYVTPEVGLCYNMAIQDLKTKADRLLS